MVNYFSPRDEGSSQAPGRTTVCGG